MDCNSRTMQDFDVAATLQYTTHVDTELDLCRIEETHCARRAIQSVSSKRHRESRDVESGLTGRLKHEEGWRNAASAMSKVR